MSCSMYVILVRQESGHFQYDLATFQDGMWATFDHGNITDVIWYMQLPDQKAMMKWIKERKEKCYEPNSKKVQ